MYADLLSGTKTGSGKSSGNGPGRLVCHHVEPVGTCMRQMYPPNTPVPKCGKSLPKEFSILFRNCCTKTQWFPTSRRILTSSSAPSFLTRRADDFIIALCNLIQRLTIDTLHVLGDIFDRLVPPPTALWTYYAIIIISMYNGETMTFYG